MMWIEPDQEYKDTHYLVTHDEELNRQFAKYTEQNGKTNKRLLFVIVVIVFETLSRIAIEIFT